MHRNTFRATGINISKNKIIELQVNDFFCLPAHADYISQCDTQLGQPQSYRHGGFFLSPVKKAFVFIKQIDTLTNSGEAGWEID